MTTGEPPAVFAELRSLGIAERILGLYEYGIEACEQGHAEEVRATLVELIGTLDLDYGEIAEAFCRLYQYCLQQAQKGEFEEVAWILEDLRDAWMHASSEATAAAPGRGGHPLKAI